MSPPGHIWELGYPGHIGELGYPGHIGELGYPGRIRELGYPEHIGELGYPGHIGELGYTGHITETPIILEHLFTYLESRNSLGTRDLDAEDTATCWELYSDQMSVKQRKQLGMLWKYLRL